MHPTFTRLKRAALFLALPFIGTFCYSQPVPLHSLLGIEEKVETYGLDGGDVILAFIDEGLDVSHPAFRNSDGSTRVAAFLDLSDPSGAAAPENPAGLGTFYSRAAIDAALASEQDLGLGDAYGSSTARAGLAAGNAAAGGLGGLAPEATLIAVKALSQGIPEAEAANEFYNPGHLAAAIEFVVLQARELSKPVVIYLNSDKMAGPTDGTSALSQQIEAFSGPGQPSVLFVTAPGDARGIDTLASDSLAPGESVTIEIDKNQESSLLFDLWYPATDANGAVQQPFSVTVTGPDEQSFGPYLPPAAESFISDRAEPGVFSLFHRSADFSPYDPDNGKREILVMLSGASGRYTIDLQLSSEATEAVPFDAILDASYQLGENPSGFANYASSETVWDGASTASAIVVNGYAIGSTWTDLDGVARSDDAALGVEGDLYPRGNLGPTFDGRYPVSVSVPAGSLFGPYPADAYLSHDRTRLVSEENGLYGRIQGNHAAAALTAGLLALMLQLDPGLDAAESAAILAASATSDSFTGTVPNDSWGAGKLQAVASLHGAALNGQAGLSPTLHGYRHQDEAPQVRFSTLPGLTYQVQQSPSPLFEEWTALGESIAGDGTEKSVSAPNSDGTVFYRVAIQ